MADDQYDPDGLRYLVIGPANDRADPTQTRLRRVRNEKEKPHADPFTITTAD